jgi:addiction module HigA family antidote
MTAEIELLDLIPLGEILRKEFMNPLGLSANQLARDIDVPLGRISEIIRGHRSITADTALRFGKYFGVSPEIWLNLQVDYNMRVARRTIWPTVEPRVRVRTAKV